MKAVSRFCAAAAMSAAGCAAQAQPHPIHPRVEALLHELGATHPKLREQISNTARRVELVDPARPEIHVTAPFRQRLARTAFGDVSFVSSDPNDACAIWSVTRAPMVRPYLNQYDLIQLEPEAQVTGRDIAIFLFFHEVAHCDRPVVKPGFFDPIEETASDMIGVNAALWANPQSSIRQFVIAYRALHAGYNNGLLVHYALTYKPVTDIAGLVDADMQARALVTQAKPGIQARLKTVMPGEDLLFASEVLAARDVARQPGLVGEAAQVRLQAIRYFQPRRVARVMQVLHQATTGPALQP